MYVKPIGMIFLDMCHKFPYFPLCILLKDEEYGAIQMKPLDVEGQVIGYIVLNNNMVTDY